MADKWAQYAEPAASAAPATAAATAAPATAAPAADKWAQYAETPAPPAAKEQPGFFESAWNAINPAPAVREWLNRPQAHRDAMDALTVGMRLHKEKREPTPAEQEIIDRGMKADLQHPEGNILAEMSGPGFTAAGQVKDGNLSGAAGTLVGGYGVPAALGAAGGTEAVRSIPTAVKGAVSGAADAATEMVPFSRYGVKISAPKPVVTGAAGAAAARLMGLPATAGAAVGAAAPVVKGAISGARAALADRLAAIGEKSAAAERAAAAAAPKRLPAAPDASFVRSVPAEPPTPKGLLGPGRTIITPAPSDGSFVPAVPDASFVRSVPAEYPQVEGGRAPAAAAPAPPAEDTALLDGIAQGQAKMPFAKLAPAQQEAVRAIARRIQDPTPLTEQPAPLPARRAPDPGPGPAVSAEAPQTPVRQPAPAATQDPAAPVQTEVNQPETPPVLESPRSPYSSSGELKSPQLRAMEIIGDNRGKRASAMAKALHENGIPLSDAKNIDATQWKSLNDSTGGKDPKGPSQETIDATLGELGKLGRSPGQAALQDAVQRNGVRTAASRAKLKAHD